MAVCALVACFSGSWIFVGGLVFCFVCRQINRGVPCVRPFRALRPPAGPSAARGVTPHASARHARGEHPVRAPPFGPCFFPVMFPSYTASAQPSRPVQWPPASPLSVVHRLRTLRARHPRCARGSAMRQPAGCVLQDHSAPGAPAQVDSGRCAPWARKMG